MGVIWQELFPGTAAKGIDFDIGERVMVQNVAALFE
jgi:hypothetical protein